MRTLAAVLIVILLAGCTSGGGTSVSSPDTSSGPTSAPARSSPSSSTTPSASPTPSATPAQRGAAVAIMDVTVVDDAYWVLGSVACASGRCLVLRRSVDGGRSWRAVPAPRSVPLQDKPQNDCPCVNHVRFASARIGYVWGDRGVDNDNHGALFVTRDGGRHWTSQRTSAVFALESLNGDVVRVTSGTTACPPACEFAASTSSLGAASWDTAQLPGKGPVTGMRALLSRSGNLSYLLLTGNTIGGGDDARSVFYTSADDGRHWTNRGEPCPQTSHEVDSVELSSAPDGTVAVLCKIRLGGQGSFVAESTDGGRHFSTPYTRSLGAALFAGGFAVASRGTVLVSADETYRSTDGGRRFGRIGVGGQNGPGRLRYLGFSSRSDAVGISTDNRLLCTTHDAGRTWHAHRVR